MSKPPLRFWLNDSLVEPKNIAGTTTLLRFLRDEQGMTATKEGCAEGDCGACTVAILEHTPAGAQYRAINSCLLFLPMLQNKRVYTAEGLREASGPKHAAEEGYHPVQQTMVQCRASQCGYCTPGIVMSLFAACYRDTPDNEELNDQVAGNLCRCTGYRPIQAATQIVNNLALQDRFRAELNNARPVDHVVDHEGVNGQSGPQLYLQPADKTKLLAAMSDHPNATLVAGGTDLALFVNKRHAHYPVVIGLEAVRELHGVHKTNTGFSVGAACNLTELDEATKEALPALHKLLRVFGAKQIRNRATIGGNLVTASPIGDLAPVFIALQAEVVIWGPTGDRTMKLTDFLSGYRQTELKNGEVLARVLVNLPNKGAHFHTYKVSKRRELDISTVSMAAVVEVVDGLVKSAVLAFGGVAARAGARAHQTEAALLSKPWNEQTILEAREKLTVDFQPISDLRATAEYRSLLCRNLLMSLYLDSAAETLQNNTKQES